MLSALLNELNIILLSFIGIIVLPYFYFYHFRKKSFKNRIIMNRFLPAKKESVFFTAVSLTILLVFYAIIYLIDIHFSIFKQDSSLSIHIIIILSTILLNDAYFYWVHYALHRFKFLRPFHKIHHKDITPTPLSAFNFHPVEAVLNFSFYLIVPFVIPMTKFDFYMIYLYMLVNNSLGHMPLEFCPRWFYKYKVTSFLNAATHHIMHHRNGSTNFSLYYLFWDKWMKTISSKYHERFNEVRDNIEGKL